MEGGFVTVSPVFMLGTPLGSGEIIDILDENLSGSDSGSRRQPPARARRGRLVESDEATNCVTKPVLAQTEIKTPPCRRCNVLRYDRTGRTAPVCNAFRRLSWGARGRTPVQPLGTLLGKAAPPPQNKEGARAGRLRIHAVGGTELTARSAFPSPAVPSTRVCSARSPSRSSRCRRPRQGDRSKRRAEPCPWAGQRSTS